MNSTPTFHLVVEQVSLSAHDSASVRTSYFREAKANIGATFAIVAFLLGGAAVICFKLFMPFKFDAVVAFGIGSIGGVLAAAWLLLVGFRDYFVVRTDLLSGQCDSVNVSAKRILQVILYNAMPALALDCGDRTLVLAGNWWEHRNRRDLWRNSRECALFPATTFVLRRLSRSGRVIAIEVTGKKLQFQERGPIEPMLKINSRTFMESWCINERLDDLLTEA